MKYIDREGLKQAFKLINDMYATKETVKSLNSTVSQEASDTNPISISISEEEGKLKSVTASIDPTSDDEINSLFN